MQNKKLEELTVTELKARIFDLQNETEYTKQILVTKLQEKPVEPPVEEKK